MINSRMSSEPNPKPLSDERLESWKEIAAYLNKGVRTVQRWERTDGLPVRRLGQDRSGFVFAYKAEVDAWWREQSRRLEPEPELQPQAPAIPDPPVSGTRPLWPLLLGGIGLVAAATIAAILWLHTPTVPTTYHPIPVTTDVGWETEPAFSPDGQQIAYVWRPPDTRPAIYVRTVGSGSSRRLAIAPQSSEGDDLPSWSPDGRFIAFIRWHPGHGAVMLIPSAGGPESQIAEVNAKGILSWSADGQWIVAVDGPPKACSIVAVSVATGTRRVLAKPVEFGYRLATLSQDRRRLIYAPRRPGPTRLFELPLGPDLTPAGDPRPITDSFWATDDFISLTPDQSQIIYTDYMSDEGVGVWRLRLQRGAKPELLYGTSDLCLWPTVSRDGRRVAFAVNRNFRQEIWRKSLSNPAAPPVPLLSSTHADVNPQYSPDGRYIAFHSTRAGRSDIWIASSDGSNPRRLTYTNGRTTATPRWSPDGQWIAFESNYEGQSDVYVVHSAGGPIRRLTDNPATDAIPEWSRDGRSIYFCSDRTGRYEIWKMPSGGGPATQVTFDGGFAASESKDGRYLYYSQTRNFGPVFKMPVNGGPATQIIPEMRYLFFAVARNGIYFENHRSIEFWDAESGRIRLVYTPQKPLDIGLALSPDDESLLFTQSEGDGADLYMIDDLR